MTFRYPVITAILQAYILPYSLTKYLQKKVTFRKKSNAVFVNGKSGKYGIDIR